MSDSDSTITTAETPAAMTAEQLKNAKAFAFSSPAKNALLHSIGIMLKEAFPNSPDEAMGVLMMAQIVQCKKLFEKHRITERGPKHRVIRKAVEEFEKRLRDHT